MQSVEIRSLRGNGGDATPVDDDREQWSFVAPAKFCGDHASAFGGSLEFAEHLVHRRHRHRAG